MREDGSAAAQLCSFTASQLQNPKLPLQVFIKLKLCRLAAPRSMYVCVIRDYYEPVGAQKQVGLWVRASGFSCGLFSTHLSVSIIVQYKF